MIGKTFSLVFLLGALALEAQETAAPPASQQPPRPTFPGQIEQVTVDVVVADKKGVPLKGLAQEDVEVFEDGVKQTVVSFEAVDLPALPAPRPKPRARVSTNQDKESARGRSFVIVFDDIHLTPANARLAKGAVAEFLKNDVREGDNVTLVATLAGAWCSARMEGDRDELMTLLKRLDGRFIPDTSRERMSDYEAMRIHVSRDLDVASRVQRRFTELGVAQVVSDNSQARSFATSLDPYVVSRAAEIYTQSSGRNRKTLDIVERSLEALNAAKGRKSLILVSEGFIYDTNLKELRSVFQAARRANSAIYFVNARGLQGMPLELTAEFGGAPPTIDVGFAITEDSWEAEGAQAIATESGGFTVGDTNDLASGLKRIASENSTYYLVGYNPTNVARDGAFRKITVKVPARKGADVRARKGYYAPGGEEKARHKPDVDPVFQEALDSPYQMGDIPLRMTSFVEDETLMGKARVVVVAEVDVRALHLEMGDGRYRGGIGFLMVAANNETGDLFRYDQKVEMKFLPATRDRLAKTWFPIRREFELPQGRYQVKIVVRDLGSSRVATVAHKFEVPDLTGFRVSTPVLTDTAPEPSKDAGEQALPVARREFEQGEDLFCQFEVFGAQKEGSGFPRVAMGYAVRRADGTVFKLVEPAEIRPTSLGRLSRLFRFNLQGVATGDYDLVMAFFDVLSGKQLEIREPFSVRPAGSLGQASAQGEH